MSRIHHDSPIPSDEPQGTLGALLYADPSRARVPESEWVALVDGIAAGNQLALHALYERIHRVVFTLAFRICGDRQTAEELTVDVFHDVWRKAPGYDAGVGTVIAWLMNLTRSRAIDRVRYEQRKKRVNPQTEAPLVEASDDAGRAVDVAESGRRLRDALSVLTTDERQAIETAYFAELSYAEVAVRLNQPLGTVKTRIRSGLGKLRQALSAGDPA